MTGEGGTMSPGDHRRRANNALGVCVLSVLALIETALVDHKQPNPASPYVWAVLGTVAAVSLVLMLRHRARARDRSP